MPYLSNQLIQSLIAASFLSPLSLAQTSLAEEVNPKDIFPKPGETLDRETTASKLVGTLSPCLASATNKSLPSGYARFSVRTQLGRIETQLERSTFLDKFIESCFTGKFNEFMSRENAPITWSFAHIISDCKKTSKSDFYEPTNVDCKAHVFLNNLSENKEIKEIIESHWKAGDLEMSRIYYNTAHILNLLQIFKKQ